MTNITFQKTIIFSIILLSGFLIFGLNLAQAYTPPIGIPDPSWTTHPINTVNPTQPAQWPATEVVGYYYIDSSDVNATDIENIYGYPNKPRITIPTSGVLAGSKIFVRRCSSLTQISGISGTAENPIWVIGVDGGIVQPEIAGVYFSLAYSNYWIIDGITFDGTNTPNNVSSAAFRVDGGSNYISFRNSIIRDMVVGGYSEARQTAAWFSGLTNILPSLANRANISNVVFYNLDISNNAGGQFLDYESGRHAILSAGYFYNGTTYAVDSFWILNSTLHNNPEDGIQLGLSANGSDPSKCRNIYIGGNTITNNGENAIDLKATSNLVISENIFSGFLKTVYRVGATSGSDGSIGVINDDGGGPLNDWWIFNTFSNSRCGIRNQSSGGEHYVVGNLFYDLNKADSEGEPTSAGYNAGVAYWQSAGNTSVHIVNNTMHDIHGGIYLNNVSNAYVNGNIVSDIVDRNIGFPITINNATNRELISNIYYDKDGLVRRDNDAIGIYDQVDLDPLFINVVEHNYYLQSGSVAINALATPNEYALFESIFFKNIFVDRDLNPRSLSGTIDIGAFEYSIAGDFIAPASPTNLNVL